MKKLLFISMIAVVVMVSCSSIVDDIPPNYREQPITARLGIESRAMVTDADAFAINFVRMDSPTTTTSYSFTTLGTGARASAAQAGEITFAGQYYAKNNDEAYFRCFNNLTHTHNPIAKTLTWSLDGKSDLLVSREWSAGNYTTPQTSGLKFEHHLCRLEIRCQASALGSLALVQQLWGGITAITVSTHQDVVYTYSNNTFNYTTPIQMPLFAGTSQSLISTLNPVSISELDSQSVAASIMIPTNGGATSVDLTITTALMSSSPQQLQVNIPSGLTAGKTHLITISFPSTITPSRASEEDLSYTCNSSQW